MATIKERKDQDGKPRFQAIIIGIQDKTKNVIGIENILQDEERIANAIADSVVPTLLSHIQFISWREK